MPRTPPAATDWINRLMALGPGFSSAQGATPLPAPHWVAQSSSCAALLGWPADWAEQWQGALEVFAGNASWPGMEPAATVYSGHQFGMWAGQLGDGRALLLGELNTPSGPMEIQLKGAGMTPYSRRADGRAVLRSSVREFLCSEAMHGLGIPTTRALCLVGSPQPVWRERRESAAVLARVAPSFLRFGHFEHFCHHGQAERLRLLADFALAHHFPACLAAPEPVLAMLGEVTRRTARLMAHWQSVGFCHGVMNTDNMSLLGLTIDYGPFGFLDAHDPGHICNHSDDHGRYAFDQQPQVAWWNLHALAQALAPLLKHVGSGESVADALRAELQPFNAVFESTFADLLQAKLGLITRQPGDTALISDLFALMARNQVDHTITFRRLCDFFSQPDAANEALRDLFLQREDFDVWAARYAERLRQESSADEERSLRMRAVNPKFILRNHLAEQAIRQAEQGDFSEVQRLLNVLQRPFDEQPESEADAAFPPAWAQHLEISCSS